ncbi:unnamed protein product [Nesidiocoris tenuis]|uniref:Lariat debranching enzyme C-terminal domain-containing protein n=1 Tax=Nesidiocoris tenuis TaxID=355587 RepID=A0A6H5HAE8_9HEMI|nr:unnamed protein product [Nesidiocoris tenuis]
MKAPGEWRCYAACQLVARSVITHFQEDGKVESVTKFLALDKCLPKRQFLQTARWPVVLVRVRGPARHATADRRGGAIADCRGGAIADCRVGSTADRHVQATAPLRGTQPAVKKGGPERAALSGRLDPPPTAQAARFNSRSPSGSARPPCRLSHSSDTAYFTACDPPTKAQAALNVSGLTMQALQVQPYLFTSEYGNKKLGKNEELPSSVGLTLGNDFTGAL